jgi:hypothetical protein
VAEQHSFNVQASHTNRCSAKHCTDQMCRACRPPSSHRWFFFGSLPVWISFAAKKCNSASNCWAGCLRLGEYSHKIASFAAALWSYRRPYILYWSNRGASVDSSHVSWRPLFVPVARIFFFLQNADIDMIRLTSIKLRKTLLPGSSKMAPNTRPLRSRRAGTFS